MIVAAIVLTGLWLMSRYVMLDVARDMRGWQEKLNLIAESRASDVTKTVRDHFKELHALSDNPSLQLYLTELQMMPKDVLTSPSVEPPAQFSYLRNLLVFTAERGGYAPPANVANIPANVDPNHKSGLAVLGKDNEMVVSTAMPQSVKDLIVASAKNVASAQDALIDISKDEEGTLYIGFVVPIFSIQGEQNVESQVGKIVAIKTLDYNFFSLLKHPGVTEKTMETVLVRLVGSQLQFLNPLLDKSEALAKQIDKDDRKFVEARLVTSAGNFIPDMKDYAGKKVLATSREISGTPWTMIVKVERDEALKVSSQHRDSMVAVFFLMLAIIVLIIIAIWWHSSSKRSLMMSYYFRKMAAESKAQEMLLRLVTDNQPALTFIIDDQYRYQFANKQAADAAGMTTESIIGKHVSDVRGTARGDHMIQNYKDAMDAGSIYYRDFQHEENGALRAYHAAYVPIAHIPVAELPVPTPGVLVVEGDITDVVNEREKRLLIHQDLIHTLVTLVDRRDPFAANHSSMVSGLAASIAQQMELDSVSIDTVRVAASLMNIGKIVIPTELLTKTDRLTDDERRIIRDSMFDAAELVKPIHFDGPVYETLRQWQEKWDGSGALKLRGEAILVPARILSVANTFVGMISPRSWRTAINKEDAIKFLMNNCESLFDRRVVVAFVHFLETAQGKAWLNDAVNKRVAA